MKEVVSQRVAKEEEGWGRQRGRERERQPPETHHEVTADGVGYRIHQSISLLIRIEQKYIERENACHSRVANPSHAA